MSHEKHSATLLMSAPDKKGLVAAIANFLMTYNANIMHADQHQDTSENLFLMRVQWDLDGFTLPMDSFAAAFQPIADEHNMSWTVSLSARKPRMAVFVSQYEHCLADLLHRWRIGELECDIPLVISNHETCRRLVEFNGIPFHLIQVTKDNKAEAEAEQFRLLEEAGVDFIVLARYMQILSGEFVERYPDRVINIHHSFLPAFDGAKPYHRAFARGVKLIGATSHYVTEDLDEGPIIEQEVTRISHRDAVEDLIQKGRDLEKVVLSRAVRWHLDNRVLSYNNKTVVFD
ncbi:formyltetrahydrofolate deformylase [Chromobacterium subtsugae]|uniref:Formyltetrahydrofolate deformylase n=1 Tax=Chromobacterium subtsugae TaxID=251747 RepID=A0ABS7FHY5_9NEIS|nr:MULTISPECIES: formyltetrahydrofolate deformylase [Chromobacterium]KUM05339.1 formyltetrahydrofolate deformylase [Chromobacterium subtsugae]KZE84718.1 formyltetrahydrofolate deformylase [Chromobacterium sp. F49]MBW7567454.1 formyltetrahydrofolate deformylase [Chromobacterium subtsugae]MBW8289672.1 formyltetrahydrofolate deformylase [Chromobacterium subtsugae]OBU84887.1 formyltetrahydrofolate deformylase [Chromobacterium subtsugae]